MDRALLCHLAPASNRGFGPSLSRPDKISDMLSPRKIQDRRNFGFKK